MAIREGRWDCTSCGSEGFLASQKDCPNCGSPRQDDVKFYLPDDAGEVTDEGKLADAQAGADWYCEFCGTGNGNAMSGCQRCGAEKGASKQHAVTDHMNQQPAPPPAQAAAAAPPAPTGGAAAKVGLGGLLALAFFCFLCFGGVWFLFGRTTTQSVTVAAHRWERTVEVEEYKWVQEGGWSVPNGGRQLGTERKVFETKKVPDGTVTKTRKVKVQTGTKKEVVGKKDLGNGYFEDITKDVPVYTEKDETYTETKYREEPVYRTWYRYEVQKWVTRGPPVKATGTDANPQWPAVDVQEGKTRKGKTTETYVLTLKGPKQSYEHPCSLEQFTAWTDGKQLAAEINTVGKLISVGEPGAKK